MIAFFNGAPNGQRSNLLVENIANIIVAQDRVEFERFFDVPKALLPLERHQRHQSEGSRNAFSVLWTELASESSVVLVDACRFIISNSNASFKSYERWAFQNGSLDRLVHCGSANQSVNQILNIAHRRFFKHESCLTLIDTGILLAPEYVEFLSLCTDNCAVVFEGNDPVIIRVEKDSISRLLDIHEFHPTMQIPNIAVYKDLSVRSLEWAKEDDPLSYLEKWAPQMIAPIAHITTKVNARIGLLGNPSDGFYGKTISVQIRNFYATVTLTPTPHRANIRFVQNPTLDPLEFLSFQSIGATCCKNGYTGAMVLLLAMSRVLSCYCRDKSIEMSGSGFYVRYSTNIPRQVGLAGSSALITAYLKCLISHYKLSLIIPLEIQANLALDAEQRELGISAGLQDRVVQAFGGCLYMDFKKSLMESRNFGHYEQLVGTNAPVLKNMWMAFAMHPKNSGVVHNTIRKRFEAGEVYVEQCMLQFGHISILGRDAYIRGDRLAFALLMKRNFELRLQLYGADIVGAANLRIVDIGNASGFSVKFSGSGGCCIGLWNGESNEHEIQNLHRIRDLVEASGYVFCMVEPDLE